MIQLINQITPFFAVGSVIFLSVAILFLRKSYKNIKLNIGGNSIELNHGNEFKEQKLPKDFSYIDYEPNKILNDLIIYQKFTKAVALCNNEIYKKLNVFAIKNNVADKDSYDYNIYKDNYIKEILEIYNKKFENEKINITLQELLSEQFPQFKYYLRNFFDEIKEHHSIYYGKRSELIDTIGEYYFLEHEIKKNSDKIDTANKKLYEFYETYYKELRYRDNYSLNILIESLSLLIINIYAKKLENLLEKYSNI